MQKFDDIHNKKIIKRYDKMIYSVYHSKEKTLVLTLGYKKKTISEYYQESRPKI
jgi:hypothetical protein